MMIETVMGSETTPTWDEWAEAGICATGEWMKRKGGEKSGVV